MLALISALFVVGVLNRLIDLKYDDGLKINMYLVYFFGISYGLLIAHVINLFPVLFELGIGLVLAVLLTKKIDQFGHALGIISLFLLLAINGFPAVNLAILAFFLLGGIFDELLNDYVDSRKMKNKIFSGFFKYRLTMEVVTLVLSVVTGNLIYFIAMVSYDAGFSYIFSDKIKRKLISESRGLSI